MATRTVSIRLSVKDGEIVKRALEQLGADGQRALKRIESASMPASKGLLALNTAGKEGRAAIENYAASAGPLGSVLSAIGPGGLAAAAGIGAITVGIGAALRVTQQALEDFDQLTETADKIGVSTDALQELHYAASQSGVEQEALEKALTNISRKSGDAARGVSEAVDIFKQLNVQVKDAAGAMRPAEDIFYDVADAVAGMSNEQERLSVITKIFGKGSADMINLLRLGSSGMEELSRKARELGMVIDEHILRKAAETNDQLETLYKIVDVNLKMAFVDLAPILIETAEAMAAVARGAALVMDHFRSIENKSAEGLLNEYKSLNDEIAKYIKQKSLIQEANRNKPIDPADQWVLDQREKIGLQNNTVISEPQMDPADLQIFEQKIQRMEQLKNQLEKLGYSISPNNTLRKNESSDAKTGGNSDDDDTKTVDQINIEKTTEQILKQLDIEKQSLTLISQGKEEEAEVLRIRERMSGASQEDLDLAESQTRAVFQLKKSIEEKNKTVVDGNAKAIEAIKDQLKYEEMLAAYGEREAFIQKEIAKLDEKATPAQKDEARKSAGDLFDYQAAQKRLEKSTEIVASNDQLVKSMELQIKLGYIQLNQGEEAAETAAAIARITADSTGLQTGAVNEQIQAVKDLAAQMQALRRAQQAQQITQEFDPLTKYTEQVKELNGLRDEGLLSSETHTRALLSINKQLRDSYRDLLTSTREWKNGAIAALSEYAEAATDAAQNTRTVFSNAFQGLEDQFTSLFTELKVDFNSLVKQIQSDLVRMAVRQNITGPLAAGMGMGMGGQGFLFNYGANNTSGSGSGNSATGGTNWLGMLGNWFGSFLGSYDEGGLSLDKGFYYAGVPELHIPLETLQRKANAKADRNTPTTNPINQTPQVVINGLHVHGASDVRTARKAARQIANETYFAASQAWTNR